MRSILVIGAIAALLFSVGCAKSELRSNAIIVENASSESAESAAPVVPPPAPPAAPPPPAAATPVPAPDLRDRQLNERMMRSERRGQIVRERVTVPPTASVRRVPSIQDATEQVSQQLFQTSAAVSGDTQGTILETLEIKLTLDPTLEREQLESQLREENPNATVVAVDARISALAWPELIAPDFDVVPSVAAEQAVTLDGPTEWIWRLKPKYGGEFTVLVDLYAVVYVGDQKTKRKYKTLRQPITITVPPVPWYANVWGWVNERWDWLWSVVLIPLIGYLLNRRKKKKR